MNFETIKAPLMGAVGGAVVMAVVGFSYGGWVTSGSAAQMSASAANTAVLARLTPMCVEQYNQDPNKVMKLEAFMEINSWARSDYVAEQGWSKLPGEMEADPNVSKNCAFELAELVS